MKIEELFKFELGMGIQNGQSRIGGRPSASKKRIGTMADDDGYTAPRVHEPVGWAISTPASRLSFFLEIQFDSSQSAQPCRIDSGKTEPSRSEAIIFDWWCSGSFLLIHRFHALTAGVDGYFRVQVDCIWKVQLLHFHIVWQRWMIRSELFEANAASMR